MWLFLPTGFVSIVADKAAPADGRLLVRARKEAHLRAFVGPDHADTIVENPSADYRWRTWMSRAAVQHAIAAHISTMDYTNFKNAIPHRESAYHDACMGVWGKMLSLQHRADRT